MNGKPFTLVLLLLIVTGTRLAAQPGLDSSLPTPRLLSLMPLGAKAGTTVEVAVAGLDLEDPDRLLFSHPGIKAEPIAPPPPAPVDPKKPPKTPPPKPSVTRFKVTVAPDVPLGFHDARIVNKWGVSNTRAFVVGDLNEVVEKEPNNDVEQAQLVELNTTINGVINTPTDVDYFVFAGKKSQRVVFSCLAASVDSRAHPGLEVYDRKNRLLATNRNYHDTDALADGTLPEDGDYFVRVFEFSHTQGSADHFYRLTITTAPWIDAVHPFVLEPGKPTQVTIYGRNLPGGRPDPKSVVAGRALETLTTTITAPPADGLRYSGRLAPTHSALDGFEYRLANPSGTSNPYLLLYATAPVAVDNEANDTPESAQAIDLPCEISGRIEKKRDRDWYAFAAKKGETWSIEILSDRLGAPTEMYFRLRNAATNQDIFETPDNQDFLSTKFFMRSEDPAPYRFVVPADGRYLLLVGSRWADTLAGPRHLYRVRISQDQPDFKLVVMAAANARPDGVNLSQGGHQALTVFALRKDGFTGAIALSVEGLPPDVSCPPQILGGSLRQTTLAIAADDDAAPWTGPIKVKGTAMIHGHKVIREARPAGVVWPLVQQQANIPVISRLDRSILLAVRDQAPFNLTAALDKTTLLQGEKATIAVKVSRNWTDLKGPVTVLLTPAELPPGLTVNNNQPIQIAPNAAEGKLAVSVAANVPPGTYNIVLRGSTQVTYAKSPKNPQKQPANIVQPSSCVAITVVPKSLAAVALSAPNVNAKMGGTTEVTVKTTRQFGFEGEFKVQLIVPPAIKGVSAADIVIPAGKAEAKLTLTVPAGAAPGNRAGLIVRVTAMYNGTTPIVHDVPLTVNVVK